MACSNRPIVFARVIIVGRLALMNERCRERCCRLQECGSTEEEASGKMAIGARNEKDQSGIGA